MKLDINIYDEIELTEVYNTVRFVTNDGEQLAITMRDSGFEFFYEGSRYSAKNGLIEKL